MAANNPENSPSSQVRLLPDQITTLEAYVKEMRSLGAFVTKNGVAQTAFNLWIELEMLPLLQEQRQRHKSLKQRHAALRAS